MNGGGLVMLGFGLVIGVGVPMPIKEGGLLEHEAGLGFLLQAPLEHEGGLLKQEGCERDNCDAEEGK